MISILKVLLAGFLFAPVLALAAQVAEVVGVKGSATVSTNGRNLPLTVGMQVDESSEIRTDAGRVKLKFIDGSVVVISDKSVFKVNSFSINPDKTRKNAEFALDVGLISQSVAKSDNARWEVRTPTVVTAVRGTEYIVDVAADATTNVIIRSGSVLVKPTNAKKTRELPVNLDRKNTGILCDIGGKCLNAKQTTMDVLEAYESRLSGF